MEDQTPETESSLPPPLKRIVGALMLGSDHPVSIKEIRSVLQAVEAEMRADAEDASLEEDAKESPQELVLEGETSENKALDASIREAVEQLQEQLQNAGLGIGIVEISEGFRFQTDPDCGPWVRKLLNRGKPQRMSRPVIETLSIIAYRQPISRSEIESIRGVGVGHVLRALTEMNLIRIVGRSDLPGKPFLFGTTPAFLDHFGLKNLNELNGVQPGVERTPPAQQKAKHVKFSFKGSSTDPDADSLFSATLHSQPMPEAESSDPM